MSGRLQIVLIICSFLFLGATISYIRRKGLDLYHSIIWFLGAAILLLMAFFPGFVEWISGVFGVETTSNFVFLILIAFLMISCLSMSAAISRHHTRIKKQVQSLAILENRLEIVEAELAQLRAVEAAAVAAETAESAEAATVEAATAEAATAEAATAEAATAETDQRPAPGKACKGASPSESAASETEAGDKEGASFSNENTQTDTEVRHTCG